MLYHYYLSNAHTQELYAYQEIVLRSKSQSLSFMVNKGKGDTLVRWLKLTNQVLSFIEIIS